MQHQVEFDLDGKRTTGKLIKTNAQTVIVEWTNLKKAKGPVKIKRHKIKHGVTYVASGLPVK